MQNDLGKLSDLIEYFNLNKQIFEKQRNNKEHMERIMGMLSQQNMKILQKEFQLYTKGLQLPTFIYLMKKLYVPQDELSKYYFVSDLIKFFQAIDVNGDGHLEWSEFTEYIIENIRRVEKPNYKNKTFEENEIISSAYSKISNEYKITKIIDTGANNSIKKIVYLQKQANYYVLEAGCNVITVFDDKFVKIDQFGMKGEIDASQISDFSFDQDNQIFCGLFQGSARFCNIKLAGAIKFMIQVQQKRLKNYHKVQYLPGHGFWVFMSKCGDVKFSKVAYKSRTQMTYSCQVTIKLHEGLITDIVQIEQPKYVLTSSMDGTIKLYSLMLKKSLTFQHISDQTQSIINSKNKKGILGIDYTREFGSYILSYGFSTKIYIYSLDISLTKGYTGNYSQHSANLVSAKFLKSYPYVLSFDEKLNLRIWDFRTFQTIQIINCQKNFINPTRLQIIPQLSQCLICQKKITQFRAPCLQKKSKQINQFYSIFDFKICSMTNNIFVFTSNDVRVYNYITGALMHVFTNLDQNSFQTNITAAEFGYKSRKFFLGDAAGYVREFDSETGDFLQEIGPTEDMHYEHKAIVKIIFLKEHSLLVVCSLDGRIMIYERNSQSKFQIIRDIRDSHQQLTSAAASVRYCLLATGGDNGTVNVWNLQKFSIQTVLVLQHRIVNIAFSPIHPIMVITQQTGVMSFFYVRPYQHLFQRYKCFLKIQNRDQQNILHQVSSFSFDLVISAYLKKNCFLIQDMPPSKHHFIVTIGQKNGEIVVANLNQILERFRIEENHKIFSTKKSMRCEIQNARTFIANERKKILSFQGYSNDRVQTMSLNQFIKKKKFQAHGQKIDQLLLIKQNSIILTTSNDKKLKVWSLQGFMNGSIDFFTFKKINWKVSQINFHKKIQAIQTCIYAIKLIQNRKFTPKEQQDIKINLLMNEFMDDKQKANYTTWIRVAKRNVHSKIRSRPITMTNRKKQSSNLIQTEYNWPKNQLQPAKNQSQVAKNQSQKGQESSQDEEILQDYFKSINSNELEPKSQKHLQSISNTQFNQIYKKLQTKIKQKIQEHQSNKKHYFSNLDINTLVLPRKNTDSFSSKKAIGIIADSSKKTKNDMVNKLMNTLLVPINEHPIITPKEEIQYEKLFNKTMEQKRDKIKPMKKQTNLLYQNLAQVKRKIKFMTKMQSNKSSIFG